MRKDTGHRAATGAPRPFQIRIPTLESVQRRQTLAAWVQRELREGGCLRRYLDNEVARMPDLLRRTARAMHGFRQNNRSDLRRVAAIPARLYHRLKAMDPHFFEDNQNLRSLRRDEPDACVYL